MKMWLHHPFQAVAETLTSWETANGVPHIAAYWIYLRFQKFASVASRPKFRFEDFWDRWEWQFCGGGHSHGFGWSRSVQTFLHRTLKQIAPKSYSNSQIRGSRVTIFTEGSPTKMGTSWTNMLHLSMAMYIASEIHMQGLRNDYGQLLSILIITPYAQAARDAKRLLAQLSNWEICKPQVTIAKIDTAQGDEADITISDHSIRRRRQRRLPAKERGWEPSPNSRARILWEGRWWRVTVMGSIYLPPIHRPVFAASRHGSSTPPRLSRWPSSCHTPAADTRSFQRRNCLLVCCRHSMGSSTGL